MRALARLLELGISHARSERDSDVRLRELITSVGYDAHKATRGARQLHEALVTNLNNGVSAGRPYDSLVGCEQFPRLLNRHRHRSTTPQVCGKVRFVLHSSHMQRCSDVQTHVLTHTTMLSARCLHGEL